ncbi:MAG: PKD domain-containing protein, partial [Firmicutes bacterium]|nr:PKD domain-containing protein [Bacillota bacterium]
MGTYTISLTVIDTDGNRATAEKTVTVRDRALLGSARIRAVDENNAPVPGASVYFDLGGPNMVVRQTDTNGYAAFTSEVGPHTVGCVIPDNNWLPAAKDILVTAGATAEVTMTLVRQPMIEGEFEIHRMTFDEIVAAGIDVSNPENQYIVNVYVTLQYVKLEFSYNPLTQEVFGETSMTYQGVSYTAYPIGPSGSGGDGGGGGGDGGDMDSVVRNMSVAVVEIPVTVSTLKEFFSVRLHIINNAASQFSMLDNRITLNVPDGLTIMDTAVSESDRVVSVPEIKGQTSAAISWILRGDAIGEYWLTADYVGTLAQFNETVAARFAAKDPVTVLGMQGLKLTVEFADELYGGGAYNNVILSNESARDVYLPNVYTDQEPLGTAFFGADGSKRLIDELPAVLSPGESIERYYFTPAALPPYTDPNGRWVLFDYYYTVGETYGLQIEMTPKPLSYFLNNEDRPALAGAVTITGDARYGSTLTADVSGLYSDPPADLGKLTFLWKRGSSETGIGTDSSAYTLTQADIGQTITLWVFAENCLGSVISEPTAVVAKADGPDAPALVTGAYTAGDNLFIYTVNAIPGAEYSSDGTTWQDGPSFGGFTADSPATVFYARIKETATRFAGAAGGTGPVVFVRLDGRPAPKLYFTVSGADFPKTVAIIPVEGAEYSFDGGATYGGANTYVSEAGETVVMAIRLKETATHNASPASAGVVSTAGESLQNPLTYVAASSYIYLKWQPDYSADFGKFTLYRAEVSDGVTGRFEAICSTDRYLGYYDYTVEQGKTYAYYMTRADSAGVESSPSNMVTASPAPDTDKPEVISVYPADGGYVNSSAAISAGASDGYRLAEIRLYCRKTGGTGWILAETKAMSKPVEIADFSNWSAGLDDGGYDFMFVARDSSGSDSDGYIVRYTVKNSPPADRVLTAVDMDLAAGVSWTKSPSETDLMGYAVYMSASQAGPYTLLTRLKDGVTQYRVGNLNPGVYWFKVVTVDKAGNESAGAFAMATASPNDFEPPVAVITGQTKALVNFPVTLSGAASTDNDRIRSFSWDFGDGTPLDSNPTVSHVYTAAGTYAVKLTVEDRQGNAAEKTFYIEVCPEGEMFGVVVSVTGQNSGGVQVPIGGASVMAQAGGEDLDPVMTDPDGQARFVVATGGGITITVTKQDYDLARKTVDLDNPDPGNPDPGIPAPGVIEIPMNRSDYLSGVISVKRMDIDEITAAGIDVTDPANLYTWEFTIVHKLGEVQFEEAYNVNGGGNIVGGGGLGGMNPGGMGLGMDWGSEDMGYVANFGYGIMWWSPPVFIPSPSPSMPPAAVYLTVYGGAHWLKEFFQVRLDLVNYAPEGIDLADLQASLDIPDGLSLAPLPTHQNSVCDIGPLSGNGGSASASWILRGDKAGSYPIKAAVSGHWFDGEPIEKQFETQEPIKVWAGSAMELYVTSDDKAYPGQPYDVDFDLVNVSDITLYNLGFEIYGGKITTNITQNDKENVSGIKQDGEKVLVKEFKPGDHLKLTFTMTFNTAQGRDDLVFRLTNVFSFTREGSNTEVPVFFNMTPTNVHPVVVKEKGTICVYSLDADGSINLLGGARISSADGKSWVTDMAGVADIEERKGYDELLT